MNHRGFLKTGVIGALDVVGQTIANNEGLMLSQPAPTQIQCANLSINSLILNSLKIRTAPPPAHPLQAARSENAVYRCCSSVP